MTARGSQTSWHPLPEIFRTLAAEAKDAVLLETAKPTGGHDRSFLFLNPATTLVAWHTRDLAALLADVDRHVAAGAYVAGYFQYECGEAFVGLSTREPESEKPDKPLAWLGVFHRVMEFRHADGLASEEMKPAQAAGAVVVSDGLQISPEAYRDRIERVQEYLRNGHSYQVNFTDRIRGRVLSSPMSVYQTLLRQQPVSYAAYLHGMGNTFLSFSPELFYRTSKGTVTVRPMKGTWPKGMDLKEARAGEELLRNDEKNRSEHVTIVDLLRNDVGRICRAGTVQVESLFAVEHYNTLLQMTSTISGALQEGLSPSQIFQSLFPSGSITGAPKRRTMEIIRELEAQPRGLYTGAIGYFAPGGESCFSVAIRTMTLDGDAFTLGVGGGITLDSNAEDEYEECRLKGAFLTRTRPLFSLLETMGCTDGSIQHLDLHMDRMADSATYFGFRYDRDALTAELIAEASRCGALRCKVRVELRSDGTWEIAVTPVEVSPWSGRVLLAPVRTDSQDVFLRHKTTNRALYNDQLANAKAAGFDEVLFQNERGELTECTISNVFLQIKGRWFTPALRCGVLPGVQRSIELLARNAVETALSLEDLQRAERIVVCNALRGTRSVREVVNAVGEQIWRDRSVPA